MIAFTAAVLLVGVIVYTLGVRARDLPEPEPVSPTRRLDDRKAAIYENLRDLQFEYRLGKLSDQDYRQTKQDLQRELARALGEIEGAGSGLKPAPAALAPNTCPHCGAKFPTPMKFCGECGKPMLVEAK
ncbi:MAG: hypothetical protein ABSH05_03985 [Bryobacteraceae bacterium]|jgi:hypothetical protein